MRLKIDLRPQVGGTLTVAGKPVFSQGTATAIFHPMMELKESILSIAELRCTLGLESSSNTSSSTGLYVRPGLQVSDDGITWYDGAGGAAGTVNSLGTEQYNEGITYGTTFATPTLTSPYVRRRVRLGVLARNGASGTANEAGRVSLRVDWRRST